MESKNPVFTRAEGFNGRNAQGNPTYPGNGQGYAGYGDPSGWSTGSGTTSTGGVQPSYGVPPTHAVDEGRMTIDSVVQKTAFTLGLTILTAAATWLMTPTLDSQSVTSLYVLAMVGAFGGFALSMVNSFKRVISPPLVLAYAVLEGLFLGAFSKVMEAQFGNGIVVGAVVGTMAAVGGTLVAYKFFNIKVTDKFRRFVVAAMFGFVALSLLDFVMSLFHASFGFNGFGPMGLISSVAGLGLGIFMLILDFDFVEKGIEAALPERESWRAAFGLTVTIVWIYIELLRILAILRGN